jgi:tRNA dimethylallyltransferase
MKKKCIIISGPTAVGKTALGIEVARHFSTSIISADSRQCYRELNIGVAKPSETELNLVKHYFINSHSIHDNINAADFEKYALNAVEEIFSKTDIALMVGGTGLYTRAFQQGLDDIPQVPENIRKQLNDQFEKHGIEWLSNQLKTEDPGFYSSGEIHNPQRMLRALEVKIFTGKSIKSFQRNTKATRDFDCINISINLPRNELYQRINSRVDNMIEQGLVEEVAALIPYKNLNALQTVGYRELFDHFEQLINLEEAITKIKQNTRHYAKRQITWLTHQLPEAHTFAPNAQSVISFIESIVRN